MTRTYRPTNRRRWRRGRPWLVAWKWRRASKPTGPHTLTYADLKDARRRLFNPPIIDEERAWDFVYQTIEMILGRRDDYD